MTHIIYRMQIEKVSLDGKKKRKGNIHDNITE